MPCLRVFREHAEDILCLEYCRPNLLATGGHDGTVVLWNFGSSTIRGKLAHEPLAAGGGGGGASAGGGGEGVGGGGAGGGGGGAPPPSPTRAYVHSLGTVAVERLAFLCLPTETSFPLLVTAGSDARLRLWAAISQQLLCVLPLSPAPGVIALIAP